jgi:hypothetical protein
VIYVLLYRMLIKRWAGDLIVIKKFATTVMYQRAPFVNCIVQDPLCAATVYGH